MDLEKIMVDLEKTNKEKIVELLINDVLILALRILAFILLLYIGKRIIEFLLNRLDSVPHHKLDIGAKQFTKSFVKLGLYIILILLGLLIFGFNEHSIFTLISAIGLGIGISLKDFLSNLAGGVILLFNRPFHVGEYIEVSDIFGQVNKIDVFSTHLDTLDSKRVIVPNNMMVNNPVTNYDTNTFRKIRLDIPISYECDHLKAIRLLEDICKDFPGIEKNKKTFINLMEYGDSSVNVLFIAWSRKEGYYRVRSELIAHIIKVFNKEGIEIPYNKLDVNIKNSDINI